MLIDSFIIFISIILVLYTEINFCLAIYIKILDLIYYFLLFNIIYTIIVTLYTYIEQARKYILFIVFLLFIFCTTIFNCLYTIVSTIFNILIETALVLNAEKLSNSIFIFAELQILNILQFIYSIKIQLIYRFYFYNQFSIDRISKLSEQQKQENCNIY